ncbi:OPT oligopeptide transporter, partial [Violaceomyces palustris]
MTVVGRLEKPIRVVELELDEEEDSPYPEVRASVSNVDDPTMPVMTFRMWFLSLFLTSIVSAANVILNARYPSPQIMPVIIQVISYPMGKGLAKILPIKTYHLPWWLGGYSFCLNPGAWNIKEHTLVCIAINLAASQAYAIYVLFALELPGFYGLQYPTLFSILFILSSQILGFGLSGFCRKFLVRPASMIWPQNLATTTILNTLHAEEESLDGSMSRWKFFCVISLLSFFSWFLPGFLFQALSTFSWVCWIWPENAAVNTIFGVASGLGASFLTFDWTQISFIANPLIVPWWAQMNAFAGFTLAFYIVATSMYFSNAWNTAYFPIISSLSYDRYGHQYNVTRIAPDHIHLDKEAYESYSPLYLSAGLIVCYFSGFAVLTSVLVHTALYHGKSIMNGLRFSQVEEDDVHAKFMRKYPQVPDWWYAAVLISCFVMAIIANAAYDTGLPVWALALSILIPAIYMLPMGFMFAMTGLTMGTNLISEVVSGYLLPGRPIAGMIFKTYGLQSLVTGLNFTQELKLGHYMKVPPRAIFIVQMVCTAISALIQVFVKKWMIKSIPELCSSYQPNRFTCPAYHVFHTASLIWGVVGPQRMFGKGSLYYPVFYGLVCGLIAPFPFWLLSKRNRKSWYRFVSLPVVFAGINYLPPSMGINYTSFILCGFAFQYLIRKHRFRWWSKYNFVTASALDFGTVLSTLFIFFTLNLPKNGTISVNWWGNEVFLNTADAQHRPLRRAPHDGFGPFP